MKITKVKAVKIEEISKILKKGGLVIMPTETLYGAFVDATNTKAVEKLNNYKVRPFGKPYSVAVNDEKMALKYVHLNNTAKQIYKTLLPGPLTVISKGKHNLAPGVESESGTLGIRIPDYPLVLNVLKAFKKPITATSANASYKKRPYSISDILNNLSVKQKSLINLVVDAGQLPKNEPSTVIDTTLDDPIVLRQGDIKYGKKNQILSRSEETTMNLAKELWQKYENHAGTRAIVFALEGPMGVGKTIFTKGLARAIGIEDIITSPTYDLEHIYNLSKPKCFFIHIDAWRLESSKQLQEMDFSKKITDKSIVAIEWADRIYKEIRKHNEEAIIIWIKIDYGKSDNERFINWKSL